MRKNLATGCRPDQLFGMWAIESSRFAAMVEQARHVDLRALPQVPPLAEIPDDQAYDDEPWEPGYDDRPKRPPYQTTQGVAVIDVTGPMTKYPTSFQSIFGGTSTVRVREALRTAVRDPGIRGILLRIDSPGGTVAGTADLGAAIKAADQKKPVYSYIEDLACSAAYWAAAQGRKVYANTSAVVGSIGTFVVVMDSSGLYQQSGVKVHVISSAPLKGAGVAGAPVTDEQLAEFRRHVQEITELFVSAVSKGRRMPIARVRELADGRIHVGTHALTLGLIDTVAPLEQALRDLAREKMAEVKDEKDAMTMAAEQEERAVKAEKERDQARQEAEQLRAQVATLTSEVSQLKAAAAPPPAAPPADPLAGLSPEARAEVERLRREGEEARARAERLEAEKRTQEFEGKAAAFKALPVQAAAFGACLMEASDRLKPESYAELTRVLKAADELVAKSGAFQEKGRSGAGSESGGTAYEQATAMAKALVEEGKAESVHKALKQVWAAHPELWKQYEGERSRRSA